MAFKKGDPGGPGRPRIKPFIDWCKKWSEEKGEKFLAAIAENNRHKQQLDAIKTIYAYGVGKPVETQILDAEVTQSLGESVEDLAREVAALISTPATSSLPVDSESQMDGRA